MLFRLIPIACFFFILSIFSCHNSVEVDINPLVKEATERSSIYLINAVKRNGMFKYQVNTNKNAKIRPTYNILRHAGAIHSMVQYYERHPSEELEAAILKAGVFLNTEVLDTIEYENKNKFLALWSDPKLTKTRGYKQAKLGGAGLGLVALTGIEKIKPGFTPLDKLQSIGRFIVFMQREDGSYFSRYLEERGKTDIQKSLFYPGEAALGLVKLYEIDPSPIWIESAIKCLEQLATSRKNTDDLPIDHWSLLATAELLSSNNIKDDLYSRELLVNHALQICRKIISGQVLESKNQKLIGAYTPDMNSTPTATRLEGLTATLTFIPKSESIHQEIYNSMKMGIKYLVNLQIKTGKYAGGFTQTNTAYKTEEEMEKNYWANSDIRIDYVQHALSAMIQYLDLEKL